MASLSLNALQYVVSVAEWIVRFGTSKSNDKVQSNNYT